jgi:hypothetical protein
MSPQFETARFDAGDGHGNLMGGKQERFYLAGDRVLDYLHCGMTALRTAVGGQLTYFRIFDQTSFSRRAALGLAPPHIASTAAAGKTKIRA